MTMVEVMISVVILTLCCGMLTSTLTSTNVYKQTNRERMIAVEAARGVLEDMHNWNFGAVFATYNQDPADDPGGAGTAPGKHFSVPGLDPVDGDPDGFVGEIFMPADSAPLLENTVYESLGMPRDLNGDIAIDALDHSADHLILPVRIVLEWKGRGGNRKFELCTLLSALENAE